MLTFFEVNLSKFVDIGALSYAITGMSATSESIRFMAYKIMGQFYGLLDVRTCFQ
jgi:hypothetical protein